MKTSRRKHRRPIPPPPPPHARWASLQQVAGYFGKPTSWVHHVRRTDSKFPLPRLIGPGAPRWYIPHLDEWAARLPTGWSALGGLRPNGFGRPQPDAKTTQAKTGTE
jgi:predicted DNA-binding transcriptional regulator AlpA